MLYCNAENYTWAGDHCEYTECSIECNTLPYVGHCRGWLKGDCLFHEVDGTNLVYDAKYGDYVECHKYCSTCM